MNYVVLRNRMVDEQLIPRGINDKNVISAFRKVDRREFVPHALQAGAYQDHPLPIGEGQTISQPYMVAIMTQCLALNGKGKVLEIGTGSGYQAAILANLAKEVYSMERLELLAERSQSILKRLGYNNVTIKIGDGTLGWPEHAPYDGIIVTAAAPRIPHAYIEQLAIGGRLVIPVGTMLSQVLSVIEKTPSGIKTTDVCGCVFVPLVGEDGWSK